MRYIIPMPETLRDVPNLNSRIQFLLVKHAAFNIRCIKRIGCSSFRLPNEAIAGLADDLKSIHADCQLVRLSK